MRIGSLFSGYGGLELGVTAALGGRVAWHCDVDPAARRVLRHRWPGVPLYGDVAAVAWGTVEPVDVLAGGFPCQDVSGAGRGAGLAPDQSEYLFERPSNWSAMARAVLELRPALVVIENVKGLLRAGASTVDGHRVGSAFGLVLGDLADLGYDAEWTCLRASDVGACHRRERVFLVASAPDAGGEARALRPGLRAGGPGGVRRRRPHDRALEATWRDYAAAVDRWGALLGRPAPPPTVLGPDGGARLNPRFAEWMMGLPAGHVTDVPGVEARPQLRLLGNGVVPQQAAAAIASLLTRPEIRCAS